MSSRRIKSALLSLLGCCFSTAFNPQPTRGLGWTHRNVGNLCSADRCRLPLRVGKLFSTSLRGEFTGADGSIYGSTHILADSSLPEVPTIPEYRTATTDILSYDRSALSAPPVVGIDQQLPSPSESSEKMRDVIQAVIGNWQAGYKSTLSSIHDAPRSPGSAPSLAEYIREGRFNPEEALNRLRNVKGLNIENFLQEVTRAQQALLNGIDAEGSNLEKATQLLQKIPVGKMSQSIQNFIAALQTSKGLSEESLQDAVKALDLDELGGWYAGSLGILWFISLSRSSMTSRSSLEQKLNEAAEVLDKEAKEAEVKVQALLTEKEKMEAQVKELSKATAVVSRELKELKLEKASRDYAVAEMKSELRSLQNELKSRQLKEKEVVAQLSKTEAQLKKEAEKLKKELNEREATEKALLERIRELQAKVGPQESPEPVPPPKSKARTSKAEQVAEPKNEPAQPPDLEPASTEAKGIFFASVEEPIVPEPQVIAPVIVSKQKASAKKSKEKPQAAESKPAGTTLKGSRSVKGSVAKTASSKKIAKVLEAEEAPQVELPVAMSTSDDWSKLTPAAVKRKSVSELTDYLSSKGVSFKDDSGKVLKKADLIEKVMSTL